MDGPVHDHGAHTGQTGCLLDSDHWAILHHGLHAVYEVGGMNFVVWRATGLVGHTLIGHEPGHEPGPDLPMMLARVELSIPARNKSDTQFLFDSCVSIFDPILLFQKTKYTSRSRCLSSKCGKVKFMH